MKNTKLLITNILHFSYGKTNPILFSVFLDGLQQLTKLYRFSPTIHNIIENANII